MTDEELKVLEQEYNDMVDEGRAMWESIERHIASMKEIRKIIDKERPGCYEMIDLPTGKLDLDL